LDDNCDWKNEDCGTDDPGDASNVEQECKIDEGDVPDDSSDEDPGEEEGEE
jgi:hypothetical protein